MRRKLQDGSGIIPADLLKFDPASWPDMDEWRQARREWDRVHGWPGGTIERILHERAARGVPHSQFQPRARRRR